LAQREEIDMIQIGSRSYWQIGVFASLAIFFFAGAIWMTSMWYSPEGATTRAENVEAIRRFILFYVLTIACGCGAYSMYHFPWRVRIRGGSQ
jgi:hypothetical protein